MYLVNKQTNKNTSVLVAASNVSEEMTSTTNSTSLGSNSLESSV